IRVFAEEGAYDHLVKIRQDPWNPISRETADHSLPYIVAAAVLDSTIGVNSFTPNVVLNPERQAFIKKVICAPASELGSHAMVRNTREMTKLLAFSGKIDIHSARVRER